MISKEKVLKIIRDFDEMRKEKEDNPISLDDIKSFAASPKKKELTEYIDGLSDDEYIDLCALMETGKNCMHSGEKPMLCDYRISRNNIENNFKNEKYYANYLLEKSELSTYLKHSIHLFKLERLGF